MEGPLESSANCPECGERLEPALARCVHCGWEPEEDEGNPITRYLRALGRILGHPTAFFRAMPTTGGAGGPLAFALVNHWLGSALSYVWKQWLGNGMSGYFTRAFKIFSDVSDVDNPGRAAQVLATQQRMMHWIWGTGSVLLDPFLTLFQIAFVSLLVFVGARLFVPIDIDDERPPVTYESALRIVCYGLTPAILSGLPIFGGLVATLFVLVVTVVGAREVYRVSTGRAIVIALFPKILFLTLVVAGFAAIAIFLLQLFTSSI